MAALRILEEQPERIVLGKGGGRSIGALIGVLVFGVVACSAFSSLFDNGSSVNPVIFVVVLVIGLAVLNSFAKAFASTRVVLDSAQRVASRIDTLFFIPIRSASMDFSLIRDVSVVRASSAGSLTLDSFPIWQVQLQATDGSTLIVNERGNRPEMDALAQNVGTLLARPIRATPESQVQPAPTPPAVSPVLSSLYQNLNALAQASNPGAIEVAPPIVAAPPAAMRARQDAMERTARGQRRRREQAPAAPPNTLVTSVPSVNADAPFDQASANLAADQAALRAYNDANAPGVAYTSSPILVMPQMPGLVSLSPSMDLPSFPPLGITIPASMTMTLETPTVSLTETNALPPPNTFEVTDDSLTLYRSARKLAATRNFRDAQVAYVRALNMNPANPAVQNDLGVTYYEQNQWQDAERSFRRAIALDQFNSASRYNLGLVLLRQGKQKESQEQFRVGMLNAAGDAAAYFRDAMQGNIRGPQSSPTP